MNENNKIDDISEISERDTPRKSKDIRQNNFSKNLLQKKNSIIKEKHKSKSVFKEEINKNKEIITNNRYEYEDQKEEEKNDDNKNKNPNYTKIDLNKIFLKNKENLLKSLSIMKNANSKLNPSRNNLNNINEDNNDALNKKRANFKKSKNFNHSCIDLRPKIRKKISVTCLKFASNISRDNDGIILFQNKLGVNNCFLNAIVQVLYHLEEFRYKLMAIKIKKEINDPVFQLYTIFNNYESLSKLNTIEMLNSAMLRKALHFKFGKYPKGKFGDPIETILELLELVHKEYFENKSSDTFCKDKMCPSHSNFLLYLKEIKFCPTCSAINTQKYDKDCFMFTVSSSEVLELINKKEEEETFLDYKYSLFKKAKYLSKKFGEKDQVRLDKCKCKNISTKKKLFLYKKYSPFMIINMTWESDFPFITDICKIFGLIPVIDINSNLFDLDLEKGKKLKDEIQSKYYLSSMILFGQRHYTCFFYNQEIKMWSFCDDEKKTNFKTYHELIVHLIARRSFPVGIIYTSNNIFLNEKKEKYLLNEEQYLELYKNCQIEQQVENEDNARLIKEEKQKIINKTIRNRNNNINREEKELNHENQEKNKKDDDNDISF